MWDFAFHEGDVILVGRESAGVPALVAQAADARLRIPIRPPLRSLNVGVAGDDRDDRGAPSIEAAAGVRRGAYDFGSVACDEGVTMTLR